MARSFRRLGRSARPAGRRGCQEPGEQSAARLRRVVEGDGLTREQQRPVEIVLQQRLRGEAAGVGNPRPVARLAALFEEQRARAGDERQQGQDTCSSR